MSELNSKTIAVLNERFLSEPTEALLGWLWESLGAPSGDRHQLPGSRPGLDSHVPPARV